MIQPIKENLAFSGERQMPSVYASIAKAPVIQPLNVQQEPDKLEIKMPEHKIESEQQVQPEVKVKEKKTLGQRFNSAKLGFMNIVKDFNNVKNVGSGFLTGAAEGVTAGALVATVGKNLAKAKALVPKDTLPENYPYIKTTFKTIGGTISDILSTVFKVIKHLPDIYTKAPRENLKTALSLPGKFINYIGDKKLIAISALIALGFIAFRTIQGKIHANRENASLDHSLNEGHVPTK